MLDTNPTHAAPAPAGAPLQPSDYAPAPVAAAVDPLTAKVAAWKQQHREVHQIDVQVGPGDVATCYIHNPNRNILAFALTRVLNKQVLEAGEFILMNCWLDGDPRCNPNNPAADDFVVVAAAMEAGHRVEMLSATSKKL